MELTNRHHDIPTTHEEINYGFTCATMMTNKKRGVTSGNDDGSEQTDTKRTTHAR
jgi:hypothetical protein